MWQQMKDKNRERLKHTGEESAPMQLCEDKYNRLHWNWTWDSATRAKRPMTPAG